MQKQPGTFQIMVKHPSNGLTDWLDVQEETTVEDVTKMIGHNNLHLNARDIQLKYKGYPLEMGKKLSDYELDHCSSVQIVDEEPTDIDAPSTKVLCPVAVEGLMQQYELRPTLTIYEFK